MDTTIQHKDKLSTVIFIKKLAPDESAIYFIQIKSLCSVMYANYSAVLIITYTRYGDLKHIYEHVYEHVLNTCWTHNHSYHPTRH